jgi:hypothetical protein
VAGFSWRSRNNGLSLSLSLSLSQLLVFYFIFLKTADFGPLRSQDPGQMGLDEPPCEPTQSFPGRKAHVSRKNNIRPFFLGAIQLTFLTA